VQWDQSFNLLSGIFLVAYRFRNKDAVRKCKKPANIRFAGYRSRSQREPSGMKRFLEAEVASLSRDDRIRTCGPYVPNVVRYRAALHPVFGMTNVISLMNLEKNLI
jgi:hypothetical protein